MATMTLKGVPDDLLDQVKRKAAEHRRSLNGEILYRLERSLVLQDEAEDWLQRVRTLRETMNVRTTAAEIIAARDEGRR